MELGGGAAVSRVLVLGAEDHVRISVLNSLFNLCGQEAASDASQGVHSLTLKTKYYTAELEIHVHEVKQNELQTPLQHDAEEYEAMVWVVDAASDLSFLETEQFVGNSIEELEFNVSLLVGSNASSASLLQLKRLEDWGGANGFEFVAVESKDEEKQQAEDPSNEKRGLDRVKEALECNMWASMKTASKAEASTASTKTPVVAEAKNQVEDEEETAPPSKILVLGSDMVSQHDVLCALATLSGEAPPSSTEGEIVHEMVLKTKYYEAPVELHLHRIEANEIVTALNDDVEAYEALLWVVDASSDRSFLETQKFVEISMEELSFEVSLLVGTHADQASPSQLETLEKWCQDNAFEFVSVSSSFSSTATPSSAVEDGQQGVNRVLEALHCNMWRSMKMLPRENESKPTASPSPVVSQPTETPLPPAPVVVSAPTPPVSEPSQEERFQASLAALSGAAFGGEDDEPDLEAFSGLLSQVQRIRDTGAVLSDEDRRRQAEQVAMQLWNLLGADESDDDVGMDSD